MFQVASTYGIARNTGHQAVANLSQSTLKDGFLLNAITDDVVSPQLTYPERSVSFDEQTFRLPRAIDINLEGYYQTSRYFQHCQAEIRDLFTFKECVRRTASQTLPKGILVSLHVRRTDYTVMSEKHPCQPPEYYESAFESHVRHFGPELRPLVFSDDISWCRENMRWLPHHTVFMDNDPFADLCLMSWCHAHVIANSSFSWWGAWLGRGRTIAPRNWFGPKGPQDWQDIYCDGWQVI